MAAQAIGILKILEALRPILGSLFDFFKDELDKELDLDSSLSFTDKVRLTIERLKDGRKITNQQASRLDLGLKIAQVSGNNKALVKAADESSAVQSLRDFAKFFDTSRIHNILCSHLHGEHHSDGEGDSTTAIAAAKATAVKIRSTVLKEVPTAAIQGIVMDNKVKLGNSDPEIRTDLVQVLSQMDDKDILNPSSASKTLLAVPSERRQAVSHELKRLSRVAAIAPSTGSLQSLLNKGLTTSLAIHNIPKETFISSMSSSMGSEDAAAVHTAAENATIRNQSLLVNLLQMIQGTGLQVIDGEESPVARQRKLQRLFSGKLGTNTEARSANSVKLSGVTSLRQNRTLGSNSAEKASDVTLNLETLFGSMDQPVSEDSTTVYSPAAYLVDLLQYLRTSTATQTVHADLSETGQIPSLRGTVLEMLFRRRPDIGNLMLSAENTDTVLPYIDLANEIMESFIVNLETISPDSSDPWIQQLILDAFNVSNEDSKELLSEPQNTNIDAYQVLANSASSLKLPYHQPIDAQRVFLEFLKVPRVELVDSFRQKPVPIPAETYGPLNPDQKDKLNRQLMDVQDSVYNRQLDAEILGLTQEEYLILTGEVLFSKEFFQVTENISSLTPEDYQTKIGLQPGFTYWGYQDTLTLLSTDEFSRKGLQYVKKQLLPRSGIQYTDLIDIVQTRFMNPDLPKGRSKSIFDELRFSYKFLQTLVNYQVNEPRKRLAKLADFLVRTSTLIHLSELLYHETTEGLEKKVSELSWRSNQPHCVSDEEVRKWVYDHFENIGKVIVLDSGEGPRLPSTILGQMVAYTLRDGIINEDILGTLYDTGIVTNSGGASIAHVTINGKVLSGSAGDDVLRDNPILNDRWPGSTIQVRNSGAAVVGIVQNGFLYSGADIGNLKVVEWVLPPGLGGSQNIDNVRLVHLDGTPLTLAEWDRLQKFIRLWKKLSWSIDETDRALTLGQLALSPETIPKPVEDDCGCDSANGSTLPNGDPSLITFVNFGHASQKTTSSSPDGASRSQVNGIVALNDAKITVDTVHNLALLKKIMSLTGLPIEQLLTFWTPIPTRGPNALYKRLFFRGNVRPTDPVFGPDREGDFFTRKCKISDNLLVVLAAFGITSTDMDYLFGKDVNSVQLAPSLLIPDVLNIDTLSQIYRYSLLAKVLGVGIPDLGQVIMGFSNPFAGFDSETRRLLGPGRCMYLMEAWRDMASVGFSWPQLRYVAENIKSPMDPLAPSARTVVQTAKTLYDGVTTIQTQHQMVKNLEEATDDALSSKLVLVFENAIVIEILDLLNGRATHAIRAPTMKDESFAELVAKTSSRAKYILGVDGRSSQLCIQGVLTDDEVTDLKALLDDTVLPENLANGSVKDLSQLNGSARLSKTERDKAAAAAAAVAQAKLEAAIALRNEWLSTIDRAQSRPANVFHNFINGILPENVRRSELEPLGKARVILAPDITEDQIASDPEVAKKGKTPAQKRFFFLSHFIPFLQDKLSRVLIEDTITSAVGFSDRLMARTVLDNIAINRKQASTTKMEFLLSSLRELADKKTSKNWNGYLAPITSDSYIFLVAREERPQPLVIDAQPYPFEAKPQQTDPEYLWATTKAIKLESGKLYDLQLKGIAPANLQWKPTGAARTEIPASVVLPKLAQDRLYDVFVSLQKLAIVINNFKLSPDELLYIYDHYEDFERIDFTELSSAQLQSLQAYVQFRDSLPRNTNVPLIQLFNWAANYESGDSKDERGSLVEMISAATGWKSLQISQILDHAAFTTGNIREFRSPVKLRNFTQLIELSKKLGADIPRLFAWASPVGTSSQDFYRLHNVAEDIQKVARSRFDLKTWPDAVRPLSDVLRENQKNALIAFLLTQEEIKSLGIYDADGLFEYFLIDTQMTPLVETSRIKQAIATVQLYIQRCLLGLEESHGVPAKVLDRGRWNWMQKYRTWEANRKVFLYPENWVDPSLRDDKSELFRSFESAVLQNDLNATVINSSIKDYLFRVCEISNMAVVGLCVDVTDSLKQSHIFCRTRTAPYNFYHNVFTRTRFRDWRKMEIEVPSCTPENALGHDLGAPGVYFIPMAFDGRVVVFIPQIIKKTLPNDPGNASMQTLGSGESNKLAPKVAWQIKLSWTELRNGKWTARQLCQDGFLHESQVPLTAEGSSSTSGLVGQLPDVSGYKFVPVAQLAAKGTQDASLQDISIYLIEPGNTNKVLCEWRFTTGQLLYATPSTGMKSINVADDKLNKGFNSFGYDGNELHSLQGYPANDTTIALSNYDAAPTASEPAEIPKSSNPWGADIELESISNDGISVVAKQPLYHTKINDLVASLSTSKNSLLPLFKYLGSIGGTLNDDGSTSNEDAKRVYGYHSESMGFDELSRPFSLYNWELGLHAPMSLIDALLKSQQFDQALEVCHYVFNPLASGDGSDKSRFWVFRPFKDIKADQSLELWFQSFQAGAQRSDVTEWRDNPFAPHVVARSRPKTYMKWIVTKYIEILIEYGDYYFRQNTLETIPNAIQLYILASHLYGPRGVKVPRKRPIKSFTYNELMVKFDAFSNALVQMEEAFPFSNQTPLPRGKLPGSTEIQVPNIFGFAGGLFFAIPDNPQLRALGEKIDDRLFKIRHSQDINGIFRKLPLFEPPIDPALLVQATAQGLSLSSVLSDLSGPMPNHRFRFLLGRAMEMANEVRSFGHALLSAQEKKDVESYTLLRAKHETTTQSLVMDMKKMALEEVQTNLEALQYARNGPVSRMEYYLRVTGEDLAAIPGADAEFQKLNEKLQTPLDQGGLKFLSFEKEEMDLLANAAELTKVVGAMETLSGALAIVPTGSGRFEPLGVGGTISFGGSNLSGATSAIARGVSIRSNELNFQAGNASRKAIALRSLNDRLQQANIAGFEISNIDKQILAAKVRVAMARRDIDVQQKQIDQMRESEEFLSSKYTNAELYTWLFGQTKTLLHDSYTQAYDMAKKVEKIFKFERPQLSNQSFIQPGYWNASRDGLLAGENLYHALKQIESVYIAERGYDYEITKNVSLRQIDPIKLMLLRETGVAEFALPEFIFDMDFPGHYLRRIKSVSVTIPCVVGPYTGVNCTLRLMGHKYRQSTSRPSEYAETVSPGSVSDDRFATTNIPINAIAVSSGQADSGLFELNFSSDRFLPFEGAGCISSWRLELPPGDIRPFDYSSITDVILTMRYTSLEGGNALKDAACKSVSDFIKNANDTSSAGGLFALMDLKNEYASSWAKFIQSEGVSSLEVPDVGKRLPLRIASKNKDKVAAHDVWLLVDGEVTDDAVSLVAGRSTESLVKHENLVSGFNAYEATGKSLAVDDWTLKMQLGGDKPKRIWMLVRYVIS